jgi:WhiB family redox-sensing transcriptional regulator
VSTKTPGGPESGPDRIGASEDWRARAACRGTDPELFFPVSDSVTGTGQAAAALRVCAACPVREPCLRWALEHGPVPGVWGGTTEAGRPAGRRARPGRPGASGGPDRACFRPGPGRPLPPLAG